MKTACRGLGGLCLGLALASSAWGQGSNDCATAQVVNGPQAVAVNTSGASNAGHRASCDRLSGTTYYPSVDVWYLYTAASTGLLEAKLSGCSSTINSSTASDVSIWLACGSNPATQTSVACNFGSTACGSSASYSVTAGQSYLIRVATFASTPTGTPRVGTATLTLTESQPPSNETCATAAALTPGTTANWNDALAQANGPLPPCTSEPGQRDLWYSYTPTSAGPGTAIVAVPASVWVSVHTVDAGCVPTSTLACGQTSATFAYAAGESYRIRIARPVANAAGAGTILLNQFPAPANDTCEAPSPAVLGDNAWDDSGALANAPFPSCGQASSATQRDVWFSYQAGVDGNAVVYARRTALAAPGNNNDPTNGATISVFAGCSGPELACGASSSTKKWVCFPVTTGQTYLIRLSRAQSATRESYTMNLSETATQPSDGETCSTATELSTGTVSLSHQGVCDDDPYETTGPLCQLAGGLGGQASRWFRFVPPSDGVASFATPSTASPDTIINVYDACGGSIIDCSDNLFPANPDLGSHVAVPATAGVPLIVRIDIRPLGNNIYPTYGLTTDLLDAPVRGDTCSMTAANQQLFEGVNTVNNIDALTSTGFPEPNCYSGGVNNLGTVRRDLFFWYTAPANGTVRLTTCWSGGSPPPPLVSMSATTLQVFTDCTGTVQVDCGDDYSDRQPVMDAWIPPNPACADEQSALAFRATRNSTYVVRVASHREYIGPGRINVQFAADPCPADFDNDGSRTVADIFAFLSAWFAGAPGSDFDNSGQRDVADIFAFLSAWFAGC